MSTCPARENTTATDHCYHPMTAPYAVQDESGAPVPAIGEVCCHCGAAHVKILCTRPASAAGHGEHLVFVDPKPASAPRPLLHVPPRGKILH